jgi:hypothetical protein
VYVGFGVVVAVMVGGGVKLAVCIAVGVGAIVLIDAHDERGSDSTSITNMNCFIFPPCLLSLLKRPCHNLFEDEMQAMFFTG